MERPQGVHLHVTSKAQHLDKIPAPLHISPSTLVTGFGSLTVGLQYISSVSETVNVPESGPAHLRHRYATSSCRSPIGNRSFAVLPAQNSTWHISGNVLCRRPRSELRNPMDCREMFQLAGKTRLHKLLLSVGHSIPRELVRVKEIWNEQGRRRIG